MSLDSIYVNTIRSGMEGACPEINFNHCLFRRMLTPTPCHMFMLVSAVCTIFKAVTCICLSMWNCTVVDKSVYQTEVKDITRVSLLYSHVKWMYTNCL